MNKKDQLKARLENYSIKATEFNANHDKQHRYVRLDMAQAALDELDNTPHAGAYMSLEELGDIYKKVVGYDIYEDDRAHTRETIIEIMREYDAVREDTPFKKLGCYE